MFGVLLTCFISVADAADARQLQWTGDSNDKVVPQCKAGYNDVSGGSAFYWSCAFHCEGGPHYATEGCICACLTPEQEKAWRGMVTTLPPSPFSPADEAPRRPGEILVTPPPATTRPPFDPVSEIPVGEIHSGGESPSASRDAPPSGGAGGGAGASSALPLGFSLATPTVAPKAQVVHNKALDMNVVVIAVVSAAGIAGATLILVLCFNLRSLSSICRKSEEVEKAKFATAPVLRLHADPGACAACTSPCCDVEAPTSRASSKISTNSGTSGHFTSSRRSSKASTGSAQPQKDTSSLLKLPRNDGLDVASGTNSVESLSSWAREHRPSLQPPSAFPGRGRSSSRTSAGSQEPTLSAPRGRSSSRSSAVSQDRGTESITSSMVVHGHGRKVSKVQPVALQ